MSLSLILNADARHIPLRDKSVQCVVTSPPYWGLRAYHGNPGMIGLEPTWDEHLDNLMEVFREVWRTLKPDGVLWLNYGDAYASSGTGAQGASGQMANRSVVDHRGFPKSLGQWKPKDLMQMPARLSMALQFDGAADPTAMKVISKFRTKIYDAYRDSVVPDRVLYVLEEMQEEYLQAKGHSWWLRSESIWHKPNPMPESVRDRPTNAHEKIFLLTKRARYFYDADAVRQRHSRCWWTEKATTPGNPDRNDGGGRQGTGDPSGANLRNVWPIATQAYSEAHFATFPEEIPRRCILAGTSEKGECSDCGAQWVRVVENTPEYDRWKQDQRGMEDVDGKRVKATKGRNPYEIPPKSVTTGWRSTCNCDAPTRPNVVLDPFMGSGTTLKVATSLNRRSVGCDLSYHDLAKKRVRNTQRQLIA